MLANGKTRQWLLSPEFDQRGMPAGRRNLEDRLRLNRRASFPQTRWPERPRRTFDAPKSAGPCSREVHMTELDERTIRERARRLWEQAGKPERHGPALLHRGQTPAQGRADTP